MIFRIIDPYSHFCRHFLFLMGISMGKWPDFEYHVGNWLKYDRSGYNSSHPSLGSPLMVWCIELTSSGHFWSFPTCLKMVIWAIFRHVGNDLNAGSVCLKSKLNNNKLHVVPLKKKKIERESVCSLVTFDCSSLCQCLMSKVKQINCLR